MTGPTADEISRSLSDLRTCASAFAAEGDGLDGRATDFSGQATSPLSFGLFLAVGAAYDTGCHALSGAATAGGKALNAVADTLNKVADAYDQDEQNNVHLSQGEW